MTLNLQSVARAMRAAGAPPSINVDGWSVDTRTQIPGDVYFALHGEKLDGHRYVADSLQRGASAAVVDHSIGFPCELVVDDTLRALQHLAAWARHQWGGRVIGITGSAGKTTTKDAIAHLLSVEFPTGRTIGNFNNHVGVPLSILRLPDASKIAVLEMGMNHAHEIRELAAIARPQIGVVTNVGYAHVEFFDSIEGVALAKRELIEGLPPDGVAILNADDPRVSRFREIHPGRTVTFGIDCDADIRAQSVQFDSAGSRFRALDVDFETTLAGRHAVLNMLAAIAVAVECGIAPERLREPVRSFTTGKMRGERIEHNGITIWNDCYNSNPEAAQAMIDVLQSTPAARRIAVLGEMLELGHAADHLHRALGRYAALHNIDHLIGVRGHAQAMIEEARNAGLQSTAFFEDPESAGAHLRRESRPGDAILFKASRGVHIERALERFLQ